MSASSDERRLARMRGVWQAEALEATLVAKAYQRFKRRSSEPRARHWSFELVVAAAVAGGLLLALGRGGFLGSSERAKGAPTPGVDEVGARGLAPPVAASTRGLGTGAVPSTAPQGLWLERAGVLLPVTPGVQYRVAAGEQVGVFVEGERHVVVGPKTFELGLEVDRASGFRLYQSEGGPSESPSAHSVKGKQVREPADSPGAGPAASGAPDTPHSRPGPSDVVPQRGVGANGGVEAKSSASERESSASWIRAAEAMRIGEAATAERELLALSRSASAETRHAAELTLAQLWLTQGSRGRALPVLSRLSREGASVRVRRRAAELLGGVAPAASINGAAPSTSTDGATRSTGVFPPP